MTVHSTLRHGALGASAVAAVTTLLLAAGCSAPPGAGVDTGDEVPEFAGSLGLPGNGLPGNGSPGNGSSGVSAPAATGAATATGNTNAAASGAGGSANTSPGEPIAGSGIGLQPAASNANAGPSSGAGGSSMAGMQPGTSPGAAGSSFEPAASGSAGSTSMPPSANPPQTPPPVTPAQNPPPSAPPPNADCAAAFFCDGFESVADGVSPAAPLWSIMDNFSLTDDSASVQVSGGNAHTGGQALRVVGSGGRTGIQAVLPQTRYFVRAWFQIDAAPRGPVFIGGGSDQNAEVRLRIQGESFATINVIPGDAVRPAGANGGGCPECVTLTPNQWFCAELFVDDATRNATLWIDGVEAASIVNGEGGWPAQPATPALFLGSWGLQGGVTSVWIDDVAAGPTRLGCD